MALARTVASRTSLRRAHVPLVSSFWLSKKPGKEAWIEPVVDRANNQWHFEVRVGKPSNPDANDTGTKTGRGDFRCILAGDRFRLLTSGSRARPGRSGPTHGHRGRRPARQAYITPLEHHERIARVPAPDGAPDTDLPSRPRFRVQNYGMVKHRDLFTPRQLTALVTFSDLVAEAREKAEADAVKAGLAAGAALEAAAQRLAQWPTLSVCSLDSRLRRWLTDAVRLRHGN